MTENMKKFLEKVTKQEELGKKADQARTKEEITELAKKVGVTLTEEDFAAEDCTELSEDELAAVAGGTEKCSMPGTGGVVDVPEDDDDNDDDVIHCLFCAKDLPFKPTMF